MAQVGDWVPLEQHDGWVPLDTAAKISPTLLASRQEASKGALEANLPESTILSRTKEAARGILEPFDLHNVPGLVESVGSAMHDALTGKGTAKAQELVKNAVMAPVRPVQNFAEGIREGDYDKAAYGSGGLLSQTAPALASTVSILKKAAPSPAAAGTGADIYRSALKAPTTMPVEDVNAVVDTALKHEIPISQEGVQKLNALVKDVNDTIDAKVKGSTGTVSKFQVAKRLSDTAKTFADQATPTTDLNAISEAGNDFLDTKPADIPNEAAQAIKKGTYKQLSGKYGELSSASIEAQKALARGLKEELAKQIPELTDLNAKEGALLDLHGVLERAVNRAANANKGRIGPMLAGGVTKALTGSTALGTATGIIKAVLDDPATASKLAIAIDKAQRANPAKYGTPGIVTAYGRVRGLAQQLGRVASGATVLNGATTSADSSGTP